eukprot:SAG25_NODE_1140_length_3813_cov_1.834141_5_plen_120_part_01
MIFLATVRTNIMTSSRVETTGGFRAVVLERRGQNSDKSNKLYYLLLARHGIRGPRKLRCFLNKNLSIFQMFPILLQLYSCKQKNKGAMTWALRTQDMLLPQTPSPTAAIFYPQPVWCASQ